MSSTYVISRSESSDDRGTRERIQDVGSVRAHVYESLPIDAETAGIIANSDLFDRIQQRRDRGLVGAIEADDYIESLEDDEEH